MEREMINDNEVEKVVGGSIVFNRDHSTCGYNTNDQYKVLNYSAVIQYVLAHYKTMDERDMLKNCVAAGYLSAIDG